MKKIIILLMGLFLISLVMAQVPTYHQFYGEVRDSEGSLVSEGVIVSAYVSGVDYEHQVSIDGLYGYDSLFLVEDGNAGDEISFYINGYFSESYVFEEEGTTELNLVFDEGADSFCGDGVIEFWEACDGEDLNEVTCEDLGYVSGSLDCLETCFGFDVSGCESSTPAPISSSTGPSGSSSSDSSKRNIVDGVTCVENWVCVKWEKCVSNEQTRQCTDMNFCNTTVDKPEIIRDCDIGEEGEVAGVFEEDVKPSLVELFKKYWFIIFAGIFLILIILIIMIVKKSRHVKYGKEIKEIKKRGLGGGGEKKFITFFEWMII